MDPRDAYLRIIHITINLDADDNYFIGNIQEIRNLTRCGILENYFDGVGDIDIDAWNNLSVLCPTKKLEDYDYKTDFLNVEVRTGVDRLVLRENRRKLYTEGWYSLDEGGGVVNQTAFSFIGSSPCFRHSVQVGFEYTYNGLGIRSYEDDAANVPISCPLGREALKSSVRNLCMLSRAGGVDTNQFDIAKESVLVAIQMVSEAARMEIIQNIMQETYRLSVRPTVHMFQKYRCWTKMGMRMVQFYKDPEKANLDWFTDARLNWFGITVEGGDRRAAVTRLAEHFRLLGHTTNKSFPKPGTVFLEQHAAHDQ